MEDGGFINLGVGQPAWDLLVDLEMCKAAEDGYGGAYDRRTSTRTGSITAVRMEGAGSGMRWEIL